MFQSFRNLHQIINYKQACSEETITFDWMSELALSVSLTDIAVRLWRIWTAKFICLSLLKNIEWYSPLWRHADNYYSDTPNEIFIKKTFFAINL